MGAVAVWPAQVTRTRPIPGLVPALMVHDQATLPEGSAVFPVRPWAVLELPAGVV